MIWSDRSRPGASQARQWDTAGREGGRRCKHGDETPGEMQAAGKRKGGSHLEGGGRGVGTVDKNGGR
jgi:hypothetical protein